MKRLSHILLTALTALFLMLPVLAFHAGAVGVTDFAEFSGHGIKQVAADTASLSFTVETSAETVKAAEKANAAAAATLERAFAQSERGCLREDSFYTWYNEQTGQHVASRSFTLTTTDLDNLAATREKLTELGATSVNYVNYSLSDLAPYRDELIRLAIADATAKTSALEGSYTLASLREFGLYAYGNDAPCPGSRPTVTITCDITATFTPTK